MEHKRTDTPYERIAPDTEKSCKRKEHKLHEARKKLRAKRIKNAVLAASVSAVLVIIAVWLMFDKLFVIRHFKLEGAKEYSDKEAKAAALAIGIEEGSHVFGFDERSAEEKAKYVLSEFDMVDITFDLPDTVVLKVKESVPVMYTVFGENGYMLSEALKVVSVTHDPSECESLGLVKVQLGNISKCVAGEFIEVDDESDEIVKKLYAVLKEEDVAAEVIAVDASDRFDITLDYGTRFHVKLGDDSNLTVKIRYMKAIIADTGENESGVIDVSDEDYRDATFKAYSKM